MELLPHWPCPTGLDFVPKILPRMLRSGCVAFGAPKLGAPNAGIHGWRVARGDRGHRGAWASPASPASLADGEAPPGEVPGEKQMQLVSWCGFGI